MAEIFTKTTPAPSKKCTIFAVREFLPQPFQATGWTDLRIGFFLSITKATNNDDPTVIGETIPAIPPPTPPPLASSDRYSIGLLDRVTGRVFLGYTNRGAGTGDLTQGISRLMSSDHGVGTTDTKYWRPDNGANNALSLSIIDNGVTRASSLPGSEIHFPQSPSGVGGYATLLTLRFQRDNSTTNRKIITMSCKRDLAARNGDILYSNTPTHTVLESNLQAFPTTVQQFGPVELSQEPSALFFYWPFRQSRLRCHCAGILRAG